ncbi:SCO3374 family protein [Streptomyces sp. URMC 126]|uniref:SCO3374 family protein n=1 Tax=Streptomyces sp. URMC 126 TaxID=3423401 RepID=UPI003F1C159F
MAPVPPSVRPSVGSAVTRPSGALPGPRVPQDAEPRLSDGPEARRRHWYEHELGWPTTGGEPLGLPTGVRFDALGLPADAGVAVLARVRPTGPVALDRRDGTLWFLTAVGSADELPELLRWLEWDGIALDLTARGSGGRIPAPLPVGIRSRGGGTARESRGNQGNRESRAPREARKAREAGEAAPARETPDGSLSDAREAVWLRPPRPGREVEPTLPVTGLGGGRLAPDYVRLVSAAATECHRTRLLRAGRSRRGPTGVQPLAFSYASRMSAGTRPRSLTL